MYKSWLYFSFADGFIFDLYIRANVSGSVFSMAPSIITWLLEGPNEMLQVMPLSQSLAQ